MASLRGALDLTDGHTNRWALLQNVVGTTLFRLTVMTGEEKELAEAINAFRAALSIFRGWQGRKAAKRAAPPAMGRLNMLDPDTFGVVMDLLERALTNLDT